MFFNSRRDTQRLCFHVKLHPFISDTKCIREETQVRVDGKCFKRGMFICVVCAFTIFVIKGMIYLGLKNRKH